MPSLIEVWPFRPEPLLLAVAVLVDLLIGDPRWLPHPVVLFGKLIAWYEKLFNRESFSERTRFWLGYLLAVMLPLAVFLLTALLLDLSLIKSSWPGVIMLIFLYSSVLAARGLIDASRKIRSALEKNDINAARQNLSHIVGRDTKNLKEPEIVRATIESVSENLSDGIIAPLFYLALGGLPLALCYKAINTLDSMVGYKSSRYLHFGRASARLDDAANFIPARISALLIIITAFCLCRDWRTGWKIMKRDARNHPSPNAGFPEAAMAGVLGIQLGGLNHYSGYTELRPLLGDNKNNMKSVSIKEAGLYIISSYGIAFLSVEIIILF